MKSRERKGENNGSNGRKGVSCKRLMEVSRLSTSPLFELTVKLSAVLTGSDRWKDAPSGLRVTVSGFFSGRFQAVCGRSTLEQV
jgi:hypothetical protein